MCGKRAKPGLCCVVPAAARRTTCWQTPFPGYPFCDFMLHLEKTNVWRLRGIYTASVLHDFREAYTRLYTEVYNNLYCCRLTQSHSNNNIDELGFKTTAATSDRVCFKCLKTMTFKNVGICFPISLRYIITMPIRCKSNVVPLFRIFIIRI